MQKKSPELWKKNGAISYELTRLKVNASTHLHSINTLIYEKVSGKFRKKIDYFVTFLNTDPYK